MGSGVKAGKAIRTMVLAVADVGSAETNWSLLSAFVPTAGGVMNRLLNDITLTRGRATG